MSDIVGYPKYDAATANCGKGVRLPTKEEIMELINVNNTTSTWTEYNGVKGRLVVSKINGNRIFLPAAGYRNDTTLHSAGKYGFYLSSTPSI